MRTTRNPLLLAPLLGIALFDSAA
ncbi:hypothetical protein QMN94_06800, partial [Klebsiella pneumoniae]